MTDDRLATQDALAGAQTALAAGRWEEARRGFEAALAERDSADANFGLASALWWLGESRSSVIHGARAFARYRRGGDIEHAAQCAVWLAITYKANFASFAVADGWAARAERLLEPVAPGPLHGWVLVARAYRAPDLHVAEQWTARAVELARAAADVDLELVARSQLGLIRVGRGEAGPGFALIDEAMAGALAGEPSSLHAVAYICCDMLNACELASDLDRAAQWCDVADEFVATYGSPFLYTECRLYYGSILAATGRWAEAERELALAVGVTASTDPGLRRRALARLALLHVRQGRLEEADALLVAVERGARAEWEEALAVAALHVARAETTPARRILERRVQDEAGVARLAGALDLLVDTHLAAGDVDRARVAARRLTAVALDAGPAALAAAAEGRVALAAGDDRAAAVHLSVALDAFARLSLPFEAARARFDLGRASLAGGHRDAAVEQARLALAAFEAVGAAADADRVAAFLRTLGVVARTGPKGVGLLTQREREVLRLVAAGLSNPEIAERLHVSRKTASHHVSSILSKLNLRNRVEAAAYAAQILPA